MSLFSSVVYSNTEITKILIPIESFYAPSDAFSNFGNPAKSIVEKLCKHNI